MAALSEPSVVRTERRTRPAAATRRLGERLGRMLRPGDVVALVGDLGAGKTQLARGICRGAGVADGEISSPTFAIVATYRGRVPVHHADLYRVGDADELHATGFQDLLGGEGVAVVEWADRIPDALPEERLEIALTPVAGDPAARDLVVTGRGERHAALARALAPRGGGTSRRGRAVRRGPASGRAVR
ncbi:MAG TPA: tRNA (adenosine(37)-N6)-threonylcarbamoyltransferase complex ATPase subunit type 1 TsaE [Anaeromyxobacteraceae bacterium]|nr:tRNA (adenosine(37)-N6)-threonylcarbamoyltransferase complex ATPase subunit type 1 TsaE [Anaeromyxobacteraceae bacterium]